MAIITDDRGTCAGQIFNLGNPASECSIRELADKLARLYQERRKDIPHYSPPKIEEVNSQQYYGKGYQDILTRKPSIAKARKLLGWEPKIKLDDALRLTFDAFLRDWLAAEGRG